jgi:hypothetical protein
MILVGYGDGNMVIQKAILLALAGTHSFSSQMQRLTKAIIFHENHVTKVASFERGSPKATTWDDYRTLTKGLSENEIQIPITCFFDSQSRQGVDMPPPMDNISIIPILMDSLVSWMLKFNSYHGKRTNPGKILGVPKHQCKPKDGFF